MAQTSPRLIGDEPQSDEQAFGAVSPSRWQGRTPPDRDWMVEQCFARGTVGLLSGDGGIGKSLLMQQLCSAAVLGRPWLGLHVAKGPALYLACEDDHDELWRRQASICRALGAQMDDVAELQLVPRVGRDNALFMLDRREWRMKPRPLYEYLYRRAREHAISYVIIDTATQTFRGNQNDETQVVEFINHLRRLAIAIQGVVILTKHPSMAGRALGTGESGNVAWNNSVRSRLYLHQDKAGLHLQTMKSNYGAKGGKIALKWERGVYVLDEALRAPDPYR